MVVVGEKIRQAREAKGLSQEFVAEQLGISQAAYSNMERGETQPKLPRLQQLAELLAVDVNELLKADSAMTLNIQTNHGVQLMYAENKDLLEKVIEAKDKHIASLEEQLALLRNLISKS